MPPKTRAAFAFQSKKRKAEEISVPSDEEERPKKKLKAQKNSKNTTKQNNNTKTSKKEKRDEDFEKSKTVRRKKRDSDEDSYEDNDLSDGDYCGASDSEEEMETEDPRKRFDEQRKEAAVQRLIIARDVAPLCSLEGEEYTLPDELLLQIFSHFRRRDLSSISVTCRQWYRLSNDKSLGWHSVHTTHVKENGDAYAELEGYEAEIATRRSTRRYNEIDEIHRISHASYQEKHRGAAVSVQRVLKNGEERFEVRDETGDVVAVLWDGYGLNWKAMNDCPDLWDYRMTLVTPQNDSKRFSSNKQLHHEIQRRPEIRRWIVDVDLNIERLEQLVLNGEAVPGLRMICDFVRADFKSLIDGISNPRHSSIPKKSFTATKQPEGFKDTIKLYKYQLDAVSWMKSIETNDEGIPYFTVYPWRQARTNLLFDCKDWKAIADPVNYVEISYPKGGILADEMGLGKTMEITGLVLANPPPVPLPKHRKLFPSRATLVLCPNHLAKQWSDELSKTTGLKVAVVTSIVQCRKYSYQDLIDFDVVIVSYQLLQNPSYFFNGSDTRKKAIAHNEEQDRFDDWVESKLISVKRGRKGLDAQMCPMLEHFYWHRIVLDEGHEFLTQPFFYKTIACYESRHSWYVTGTPFPSHHHLDVVKAFLGIDTDDDDGSYSNCYQLTELLNDLMLRELYWRHTKETVKGEYQIPECVEDLVLMDFDEIEAALYADARDEVNQSHVCGSLLHKQGLDARRQDLILAKEKQISALKRSILESPGRILKEKLTYEATRDPIAKRVAFNDWKYQEKRLEEEKAELERNNKVLAMAKKTVPFKQRKQQHASAVMVERIGTKLTRIITYLKELFEREPQSRVIFFSQFNETLTALSGVLSEHNIDRVFVEGNVFVRTKAITNFKKHEDIKVILLSLKNAASGTNLIEATHVILMDPVTGSKKEAQAIESQAIGRAHRQGQTKQITIVRFIVKNTIEHALYLRNNDVNEDTTVVLTKNNRPQLVRSSSLTSIVASDATLQRSGSFARPFEPQQTNTNVMSKSNSNAPGGDDSEPATPSTPPLSENSSNTKNERCQVM